MATELEELRARSAELAAELDGEEALEVNAAILDLDPGDPVATNRLGIGLLKAGRVEEAIVALDAGLRLNPDNPIMLSRRAEADKVLARGPVAKPAGTRPRATGRAAPVGWTDFEPADLVEHALRGPGRDACLRLCAASIRASEAIDPAWTAVTPIKDGRRFRTIGGIFTGVGPWKDVLTVAVPQARSAVIERVEAVGGRRQDEARAVPCVQVAVPRGSVEQLYDELLEAHREHLRLSLEAGPPTHLKKHHPELRRYILEQADVLEAR